jgi:hypothetical protein
MKKSLLLLLLFCLKAYSQPIITETDFTHYSVNVYSASPIGLSPGSAGANQVWDFSAVTYSSVSYSIQTVPSSSAPFFSTFPTTNYVQKISYPNNPDAFYVMSRVTSTGVESFANTSNSQIIKDYTPDTQLIPLPLSFNQSYTDVFQATTETSPTTRINLYDGYGTLITPFGTFNNVIRMKQTEQGEDVYNWFLANPYTPLMFGQFGSDGGITFDQITTLDTANLALNENVKIYPNPTSAIINLEFFDITIDKIVIYDVLGKAMIEQTHNTNQVNVENLAAGIYIVKAFADNEMLKAKFVKE